MPPHLHHGLLARRLLVPGLLAGALLRLAVLPTPGTGDVTIWKVWSVAASQDLTGVYGVGGSPTERRLLRWQNEEMTVDYPPAALEELAIVGRLYGTTHPGAEDSRQFNAAVKLPGLLAEVAIVGLILTWGRRRFGMDAAAWTALAWWLNPALVIDGPLLGYLDALMAVPAVLALVCAVAGAAWLSGALLALALLTKAQAIFTAPVILAALVARRHDRPWRRALLGALGGATTSVIVTAPYIARGAWPNVMQALGRLATHDSLSAYGANVWWIVTWVLRVFDVAGEWGWWRAITQDVRILAISRAVALGVPNPRLVGMAIVGGLCAWGAWRAWRSSSTAHAAALAGWSAFAYALFAAQVHENHLYLAVPFLVVAGGLDRRYRRLCWAVSMILSLNLVLFYGFGRDWPDVVHRSWTVIDASVWLAFGSLAVFTWATRVMTRPEASG